MKEMGIDADASSVNEFNGKPASKILQRHACVGCQSKCHSHCHLIHIFSVSSPHPHHRDHFQQSFGIVVLIRNILSKPKSRDYSLACAVTHSLRLPNVTVSLVALIAADARCSNFEEGADGRLRLQVRRQSLHPSTTSRTRR